MGCWSTDEELTNKVGQVQSFRSSHTLPSVVSSWELVLQKKGVAGMAHVNIYVAITNTGIFAKILWPVANYRMRSKQSRIRLFDLLQPMAGSACQPASQENVLHSVTIKQCTNTKDALIFYRHPFLVLAPGLIVLLFLW